MKMYNNSVAIAVKSNGKILRETKDIVRLPYGSEFSVLVKNLNSKRLKFTLHIDGTDALDGTEIIVNANSDAEIKRFIRSGNMEEGNAFKFIERTAAIEDGPRGIKVDDGLIRVEFWFEQDKPEIKVNDVYWQRHYYRDYPYNSWGITYGNPPIIHTSGVLVNNIMRGTSSIATAQTASTAQFASPADATSMNADVLVDKCVNEVGITVPGSKVEQKFTSVYGFKPEVNSNVIILRMVGMVGDVEVTEPVTVQSKPKCTTCGRLNKSSSKFCTECGTALLLL